MVLHHLIWSKCHFYGLFVVAEVMREVKIWYHATLGTYISTLLQLYFEFQTWSLLSCNIGILENQFSRSDFIPVYPRSILGLLCYVMHHIKSTLVDYLELKRFWDPSTYSWEKTYITCLPNFWTHCSKQTTSRRIISVFSCWQFVLNSLPPMAKINAQL